MHDPVVTPEAVALDLEPATVGSRTVAIVLDYLLMGAGLLALGAAEAAFGFGGFVPNWLGIALLLLLGFSLQFGYPIGFETLWRGRTPGKAAMGLRVLTLEGAPVRFRHSAARAAVGLVELAGTLGAIAVISSFASPRGQRLGDLVAGTMVVRERRSGGTPRAVSFAPPPGLESYVRILDASRLDAGDYATIRELLLRPLDEHTRESIARQIAERLAGRAQPAPPRDITAVTWLRCVAAAVQSRGRGPGTADPTEPASSPPRAYAPSDYRHLARGRQAPARPDGAADMSRQTSRPDGAPPQGDSASTGSTGPPADTASPLRYPGGGEGPEQAPGDDDEPGPPAPPSSTGFRPPA